MRNKKLSFTGDKVLNFIIEVELVKNSIIFLYPIKRNRNIYMMLDISYSME